MTLPLLASIELCPASNPSYPPCRDLKARQTSDETSAVKDLTTADMVAMGPIRLWQSSLPAYRKWLEDNADVNAALTDPSSTVLSRVSDDAMGKLFDGTWVTKIDLAVDHP